MCSLLPAILALCLVVHGATVAPSFCRDRECPTFTTEAVHENVEVRNYEPTVWAMTNFTARDEQGYSLALSVGFARLFDYISGANDQAAKIAMTAPVMTAVHPGTGPHSNTTFTVAFFLPTALHTAAPTPSAPEVYVESYPAVKVAALSFGGFAMGWPVWKPHFAALAAKLQAQGIQFRETPLVTAGYDGPQRNYNRHNEAWYLLE